MIAKPLSKIIGENISKRRKKLNLSQKELAVKLGLTYESMSRIENGKAAPKIARMEEIATYLECSVSALFRDEANIDIKTREKADILVELLASLPEEKQDAVMEIVYTSVKAMHMTKK